MPDRNPWRVITIAAMLLLSYAYFYEGESNDWNQNARFDLTRAIVEQHTLIIDAYHWNTGSKALLGGHYYSDKAPGLSLAAVLVWASVHAAVVLADLPGRDSTKGRGIRPKTWFSTLAVVGLPAALAGACIFLLALALKASPEGAAFGSVVFGLGTPMWSYATLFRSPATVTALLLLAFAAAVALRRTGSPRRDLRLGFLVGLAAGWATVTEYPAAPAAAILALLALAQVWPSGRARMQPVAASIAVGALLCAGVLLAYHYLAFGSPFHVGYAYTTYAAPPPAPEMSNGLFGITYPRFWILRELLVGRYRGLLPLAPVLTLAPVGLGLLWRRRPEWRVGILGAAALASYYVLLNASFRYWDGGYSTGPRHLAPLLPYPCIALAMLWTWSRPLCRALLAILALAGMVAP